jgi:hypothetical protein
MVTVTTGEFISAEGVEEGYQLGQLMVKWSRAATDFVENADWLVRIVEETDRLRLWEKNVGGFNYPDAETFLREKVLFEFDLTEQQASAVIDAVRSHKPGEAQQVLSQANKAQKLAASGEEVRKKRGRPTNEEREEQANKGSKNENTTFNDIGRGAAYRTAKLRRDHPEIADRMAAGEFKSVAHAERVARGEPEPVRMTPIYAHWEDPQAAATRIREKLGEEFAVALKALL